VKHLLHRGLASKSLRIIISASILGALAYLANKYQVGTAMRGADMRLVTLGVLCYLGCQLIAALRWHAILHKSGFKPSYRQVLRANLIGVFVSNFMPGVAGGDLVRPVVLFGTGTLHKPQLYASVLFERLCGIAAVMILAAAGAAWLGLAHGDWRFMLVTGVILIGLAAALSVAYAVRHISLDGDTSITRYLVHIRDGSEHLIQYVLSPYLAFMTMLYSLAFQVLYIVMLWCFLYSLGQVVPLSSILLAAPLSWLAAMTPISINGLGVREGTLVVLLVQLGASQVQVTGAALLGLVPLFITSVIGAVWSLKKFNTAHERGI